MGRRYNQHRQPLRTTEYLQQKHNDDDQTARRRMAEFREAERLKILRFLDRQYKFICPECHVLKLRRNQWCVLPEEVDEVNKVIHPMRAMCCSCWKRTQPGRNPMRVIKSRIYDGPMIICPVCQCTGPPVSPWWNKIRGACKACVKRLTRAGTPPPIVPVNERYHRRRRKVEVDLRTASG